MILRVALVSLLALAPCLAGCRRDGDNERSVKGAGLELAVLGQTPEFSLVDQGNRPVTRHSFDGKVWAAAFMFTRCPTICPEITRRMKGVQERAKTQSVPLELVSFSVDPDNDTPEVLTKYASSHGASLDSWHFLTGKYEVISQAAEQGFKIALEKRPNEKQHGGILHGSHLVLVDKKGKIRGYYRTTEEAALNQLLKDASSLTKE